MPHVITRPGYLSGMWIATLLALTHAANDALTSILGALLPTLAVKFSAGPLLLSVLVAVFSISSSASQPILGSLADRVGLRQVAAIGVGLAAITLSLIGVAPTVLVLILLLLLGGLGSAALHPISTSIVGGSASKNPSLAVGLFTAGGMVGFAIGPVLVGRSKRIQAGIVEAGGIDHQRGDDRSDADGQGDQALQHAEDPPAHRVRHVALHDRETGDIQHRVAQPQDRQEDEGPSSHAGRR